MVEGEPGCSGIWVAVEYGETYRQITALSLASACVCQELNPCPQSCLVGTRLLSEDPAEQIKE